MKTKLITITLLFFSFNSNAQEIDFNMENKAPLLLNPALTGVNSFGIASVFHQNYMPSVSGNFKTSLVSYQTPVEKLYGGFGAYYLLHQNVFHKTDNFGLSYSYQANLSRKLSLSIGTSVELLHNQYNTAPQFGDIYSYNLTPYQVNTNLGLLLFSQNAFFGGSIRNISTAAPLHFMANTGYRFTFLKKESLQLIPTVSYTYQDQFQNVTVKLNTSYKWAHLSFGYREGDSFLFAGGIDIKSFNINYGYNITTSKLTNAHGGSHEFSIRYKIIKRNTKRVCFKGIRSYDFNLY